MDKTTRSKSEKFIAACQKGTVDDATAILLEEVKMDLMMNGLLVPSLSNKCSEADCVLVRSTLEHAVFFSILQRNLESFERHISLVKAFYVDFASYIPLSDNQCHIIGLYLLALLAQNRIAEYHSELELIPKELLSNPFIGMSVMLEHLLMEGSYRKVQTLRASCPSPYYLFFMDLMLDTLREESADCAEASYDKISHDYALKLFFLDSLPALTEFCTERGYRMTSDGFVVFSKSDAVKYHVPADEIVTNALLYAREMDRIV